MPQPLGRGSRTGADFKQVVAEIDPVGDDRKDVFVQVRGPFGRAEQFAWFSFTDPTLRPATARA